MVVLFSEIFLISYFEKRLYGTLLTPINILTLPYLFVLMITMLFSRKLGFAELYVPSVIIWIIGLPVFWLPSIFLSYYLQSKRIFIVNTGYSSQENDFTSGFMKFLLLLSWISIFIVVAGFLVAVKKFGIDTVGSDKFTSYYGSGISGHFMVLNILLFIYFAGIAGRKNVFIIFTIFIFLATFILYQVKTWVFIPFISGIFYRYYRGNFRLRLKNVAYIVLMCIVFFFATYYFTIGLQTEFLLNYIMDYAFSGILGLSEFIRRGLITNVDSTFLIRPLENLFNVVFNLPVKDVIQDVMVNISGQENVSNMTNVRTFFGTIYTNSYLVVSLFYVSVVSFIIYYIFIASILYKNKWIILLSSFFLGGLFMGWFDFYFNTLNYFEIPVYMFILNFLSRIRLVKTNNK
jgi:hypothetical protein